MDEANDYTDDSIAPVRLGLVEYVDVLCAGLAECLVASVVGALVRAVVGGGMLIVLIVVGVL